MPDDDWALSQGTVDERNEARNPLNALPVFYRFNRAYETPIPGSDVCECGHWSRHHNIGKHGGCGHCSCRKFKPDARP